MSVHLNSKMEQAQTAPSEDAEVTEYSKKMDETETASTVSPPSPQVCLLLISPLSPEDYIDNFADGDVDEHYRRICCTNLESFRGSWQLLLAGRSDSIETMFTALGIGILKRKLMATYASITDITPVIDDKCNSNNNDNNGVCPTIKLTTHLPLKQRKEGMFCFDGSCGELEDTDTGKWQTRCVWLNGRALQRRWGPLGVMWDTRCVFTVDPYKEGPQEGPIMLFQWTFHPHGKEPIRCHRWLKKV